MPVTNISWLLLFRIPDTGRLRVMVFVFGIPDAVGLRVMVFFGISDAGCRMPIIFLCDLAQLLGRNHGAFCQAYLFSHEFGYKEVYH